MSTENKVSSAIKTNIRESMKRTAELEEITKDIADKIESGKKMYPTDLHRYKNYLKKYKA